MYTHMQNENRIQNLAINFIKESTPSTMTLNKMNLLFYLYDIERNIYKTTLRQTVVYTRDKEDNLPKFIIGRSPLLDNSLPFNLGDIFSINGEQKFLELLKPDYFFDDNEFTDKDVEILQRISSENKEFSENEIVSRYPQWFPVLDKFVEENGEIINIQHVADSIFSEEEIKNRKKSRGEIDFKGRAFYQPTHDVLDGVTTSSGSYELETIEIGGITHPRIRIPTRLSSIHDPYTGNIEITPSYEIRESSEEIPRELDHPYYVSYDVSIGPQSSEVSTHDAFDNSDAEDVQQDEVRRDESNYVDGVLSAWENTRPVFSSPDLSGLRLPTTDDVDRAHEMLRRSFDGFIRSIQNY